MNRIKTTLFAALLALACAGEDSTAITNDGAYNWTYVDGTEADYINAPDVPEFQDPDWNPEYGTVQQPWVSQIYHGVGEDNGQPCYGAASDGGFCLFPPYKQINVTTPNWNSDVTGSNCATQRNNLIAFGGSQAEFDLMKNAYVDGLASLNGLGTNVVVKINNSSGTNVTLKTKCANLFPALGLFSAKHFNTPHVQLPTVNGINPTHALHYIVSGTNTSYHEVDLVSIWDFVTRVPSNTQSGCGKNVPGAARNLKLAEVATFTGKHEGLHMLGFDHFSSGIMGPMGCSSPSTVASGFGKALGLYNGAATGGVTITQQTPTLADQGPL
jgi:hypothetical protein